MRKIFNQMHIKMEILFYESPVCLMLGAQHEGVLCSSGIEGGFNHGGVDGNDDDIFNNKFLETL